MDKTTYPAEAVEWLVGPDQKSVLEIGAGGGGLTAQLIALGHDVHATDPSSDALDKLGERFPRLRTSAATAERLPNLDSSVDVVVCRRFNQYDEDVALAEIARVLRPGGHVAIIIEAHDVKIPWVRKFSRLINRGTGAVVAPESLIRSVQFGFVEDHQFRHWSTVDEPDLIDITLAEPAVAQLDPHAQERVLAEVRALYADYGRGRDGMQLPSMAYCFKATVVENPWSVPAREGAEVADGEGTPDGAGGGPVDANKDANKDDGDLLFDFR
jgi:SAM-dependent methyltransferase